MTTTQPVDSIRDQTAPAVLVESSHLDPKSGALWVHKDLVPVVKPWEHEDHVGPVKAEEHFGDVPSWAEYVKRFASDDPDYAPLITWNARGLRAVLDYHSSEDTPGRCQWTATHPFVLSREWQAWSQRANGRAMGQRELIEFLEDHQDDVKDPDPATLTNVLRLLRAQANAKADTELAADGSTKLVFSKETAVRSGTGDVTLPSEFSILIPVLKGHVDAKGAPLLYRLAVRVRVSVGDDARLAFRLSIPNAERTLDAALLDQVESARAELSDTPLTILRAAD